MKRPRPKGPQIGLMTDPEVLNRNRMYRQPLGLLDYPAVKVQSNNPTIQQGEGSMLLQNRKVNESITTMEKEI